MKKKFTQKIFFLLLCLFQVMGMGRLYAGNAETITGGKCYTINRFGDKNAFMKQNSSGAIVTGAYAVTDMCFWELVATDNPDCYYIKNASSGLYVQSSKAGNSATITLGKEPVEYKIAKDQHAGVSTSGYYYLCSTDQTVDNTKAGTKGLNYSSGTKTVVSYDIVSGTNANSYWEVSLMEDGVTPPQLPNDNPFVGDANKYYTFASCNTATALMAESNAGKLTTATFSIHSKVFWKLIPTENADCYYVQNATSGKYIQSSNQTKSSQIPMGDKPVEFKIGKDLTDGAETYGYFYFCSTDQSNIPSGAIGLNYDAFNTKNIVAWDAKSNDKNSYWSIKEVEYTYEEKLVPSSEEVQSAGAMEWITLKTTDGKYLAADGNALTTDDAKTNYHTAWAFVGTTNLREGFLMLNYSCPDKALARTSDGYAFVPYEEATRWFIEAQPDGGLKFIPYASREEKQQYIQVGDAAVFTVDGYRTPYALATQVYTLPCGTATGVYLSKFKIEGGQVLRNLDYQATQKPQSYYTMYTQEKPMVGLNTTFILQTALGNDKDGVETWVYFDWNRDGVFEKAYQITGSETEIEVPADAKTGKSRIRVRLTDNALKDAEDDVTGALYDFILYVDAARTTRHIQVKENGQNRGKAYIESPEQESVLTEMEAETGTEVTVNAEPLKGIEFLCWMNGKKVVSTDAEYAFTVDQDMNLVACFSPSDQFATAIEGTDCHLEKFVYEVTQDQGTLRVQTDAKVKAVLIYATNGTLVKKTTRKVVSLNGIGAGTYIVKVITAEGDGARKILLD